MEEKKLKIREVSVKRVSVLGIIGNLVLLVMKFIMGFISNSQSMIADALHSGEDMLSSIMSYIGAKMSYKPKDEEHPYGHGKAEYIFSLVISISMIIASITMVFSSIESIISGQVLTYSIWLIVICTFTIVVKFILYMYAKIKYKNDNNILILASMEDHRNDIFITIGTAIGIIASKMGYPYIDGIVGSIISCWVGVIGIKIFIVSYKVLMDTGITKEQRKTIENVIKQVDKVCGVREVITKPVGDKYLLILKLNMPGEMTIKESHDVQKAIKWKIISLFEYISEVIIHVNPCKVETEIKK